MDASPSNPPENALPQGVSEQLLTDAVTTSGYPLQSIVASKLLQQFSVTEEWSFTDRETGQLRSLDVFAYRRLAENTQEYLGVSPGLALLIECKRSEHPYVFFRSVTSPVLAEFPPVHGLYDGLIELRDRNTHIRKFPVAQVLGLSSEPFATAGPVISATVSRTARKGDKLELSGADPFSTIVLPLVSATDHSFNYYRVKRNPQPSLWFPTLVVPICVLDAPMVVSSPLEAELQLNPWVRLIRQETKISQDEKRSVHYAVDVVHVGFFATYVEKWLLPFAETFRARVEKRGKFFINLSGWIDNFENWSWNDVRDP